LVPTRPRPIVCGLAVLVWFRRERPLGHPRVVVHLFDTDVRLELNAN
jgi:hypothetical protein